MTAAAVHVVVLGAGFGGLTFCQHLDHPLARLTLVDRQNHHLFQPLLYQVATAGLSAPEIAQPIRSILAHQRNVTVRMDEVTELRPAEKLVMLGSVRLPYDYLVVALGGVTSYFGHPEWEAFAPGLKSLDDALALRRKVLLSFEKAETAEDEETRRRLMTLVVVGGGPTGVELAGAFAELGRHVLRSDFRRIDPRQSRVILLEAGPRILTQFPPHLSDSATSQLRHLGVEVRTDARVRRIAPTTVELEDGSVIQAENIVWAAGVSANPLATQLGAPLDRSGRVLVSPDLSIPGHPEVFVIGDMAAVVDASGRPVPGVSPAAMQMGRHVADIIRRELGSGPGSGPRPRFNYVDKGSMATIGRSAAVAKIGRLELQRFSAWLAWLFIHLVFLIGFRNKLAVLLQWAYSYVTYGRGARLITGRLADSARLESPKQQSS